MLKGGTVISLIHFADESQSHNILLYVLYSMDEVNQLRTVPPTANMSEASTPACLEQIKIVRVKLYDLSRSESTSARDGADLRSSIELLDAIGKRGSLENRSLVLHLTLLLHELLHDSKQGMTIYCTSNCLTDLFRIGWFRWVDCADLRMGDRRSQPPTVSEMKAMCQEIRDFSDDVGFAE